MPRKGKFARWQQLNYPQFIDSFEHLLYNCYTSSFIFTSIENTNDVYKAYNYEEFNCICEVDSILILVLLRF